MIRFKHLVISLGMGNLLALHRDCLLDHFLGLVVAPEPSFRVLVGVLLEQLFMLRSDILLSELEQDFYYETN